MFSRWIVALSFMTMALGCSLETGDVALKDNSLRYNTARFSCLSKMGELVDSYFQGEFNDQQVTAFVGCLRSALDQFESKTRGKEMTGYEPMEIVDFLNKNFNARLGKPLVDEIMVLKTLLVGGKEDFISRKEYAELVKFLDVIEEEAIRNIPYVRLYRIKIQTSLFERVDPVLLRAAKVQLEQTARRLADYLGQSGKEYHLDSFQRLITQGRNFLQLQAFTQTTDPSDVRELASRFKEISVGADRHKITSREWTPFLSAVANVYGAYLDFEYLIRNQGILYGDGLENFISLADHVFNTLQASINQQEKKVIEFPAIFGLIDVLGKMKMLPLSVRAESLKPALEYTIQNVLRDPTSNIKPSQIRGLNTHTLNEARKEFYNWAESQRLLSMLAEQEVRRQGIINDATDAVLFGRLVESFDMSPLFTARNPEYEDKNIEYLVKHINPFFKVGDNRVWIVPPGLRGEYKILHGPHDLGLLNVIRAVVRQLIRGFASTDRVLLMSEDPSQTGVTAEEMELFYQTARHLGEDLLFMDPRKDEVGLRIFREGNIFTFTGNGIQEPHADNRHLLNFTEIIEVISFMWSGGQVRDALHKRISNICEAETGYIPEVDIMNTVKLDRNCFFRHLSDENFSAFSNLPFMQKYLEGLDFSDRAVFYDNLEEISKIPTHRGDGACYDNQHIELAELATIATVAHYVESIFILYDKNGDQQLDQVEIMTAFPRFRGFLKEAVKKETGKDQRVRMLKAIFSYLVLEKKFPDGLLVKTKLYLQSRNYSDNPDIVDKNLPEMNVDRGEILEILVMLNESTIPKDAPVTPQCVSH